MASVEIRAGESLEAMLRRFQKQVISDGVLSDYRKKRWFISKGEQGRMEKKRGIRRAKQKARRESRPYEER